MQHQMYKCTCWQCSKSCGLGRRRRAAVCVALTTDRRWAAVTSSLCGDVTLPSNETLSDQCERRECPAQQRPRWFLSSWKPVISYLFSVILYEGHATSSFTWPFDTPCAISCRCSIVTEAVSAAICKIMCHNHFGGHDLDLSRSRDVIDHVTIRFAVCCLPRSAL